jgi:hypothetical protein
MKNFLIATVGAGAVFLGLVSDVQAAVIRGSTQFTANENVSIDPSSVGLTFDFLMFGNVYKFSLFNNNINVVFDRVFTPFDLPSNTETANIAPSFSDLTNGFGSQPAPLSFSNGSGTPGSLFEIVSSAVPGSFLDSNIVSDLLNNLLGSFDVNGQSFSLENSNVAPNPEPVPETLTSLGFGLALGVGTLIKKQHSKKLKRTGDDTIVTSSRM